MIEWIALSVLSLAGVGGLYRVLRGPSLPDRIIGLDVVLVCLMGGIATDAAASGSTANLDVLVIVAIVGFTTTLAASRFTERLGRGGEPE